MIKKITLLFLALCILGGCQQQTSNPGSTTTIKQKAVTWKNNVYLFIHQCEGKVITTENDESMYCIGTNILKLTDQKGREAILSKEEVTQQSKAPVFALVEKIENNSEGVLLIAYRTRPCKTDNDCDGTETYHVNLAFNISKWSSQNIKNYPPYAEAVWNTDGMKAIFLPQTCDGSNDNNFICEKASLMGYDLATDTLETSLTEEKASYSHFSGEWEMNTKWKKVTWISENTFTATLTENGKEKEIKGSF